MLFLTYQLIEPLYGFIQLPAFLDGGMIIIRVIHKDSESNYLGKDHPCEC